MNFKVVLYCLKYFWTHIEITYIEAEFHLKWGYKV